MITIKNDDPYKVGQIITLQSGKNPERFLEHPVRTIIDQIPCRNTAECESFVDGLCHTQGIWLILECFPEDQWSDSEYAGGITYCYQCL